MKEKPFRLSDAAVSNPLPTGGRPSIYTEVLAEEICRRVADGESLRKICAGDRMPGTETLRRWLRDNEEFRAQYARAKEDQADAIADEIIDIADDARNDFVIGEDGERVFDHEHVQRSRLRIDARKWKAGKLRPKVYGDKLDVHQSGNLQFTIVSGVPRGPEDAPPTIEHDE